MVGIEVSLVHSPDLPEEADVCVSVLGHSCGMISLCCLNDPVTSHLCRF